MARAKMAGKNLPMKLRPQFTGEDFVKGVRRLETEIAQAYLNTLRKNFRKNTFGNSLPEGTVKRKKGRYKNTPLIATREYVNDGIIRKGKYVTVREGNHASGLSYLELASTHEYGRRDKSIPARPVWRPSFAAHREVAKKMIEQFLYPKGRNE